MAKIAFIVLQVLVGLAALASLAVTAVVIVVSNLFEFAKGGLKVIGAVVTIFASGFQKDPQVAPPDIGVALPMLGLLIYFLLMLISVFLPGQKIFLHVVAGMGVIAAGFEIWRVHTTPNSQVLYIPVIVLWAIYYGICLRRA